MEVHRMGGGSKWSQFHGDVAASSLHWYDEASGFWLAQHCDAQGSARRGWGGWAATDAAPARLSLLHHNNRPWDADLDASGAPFYRWFVGGLTNAAFSECDRHVLAGRHERTAFIVDPPIQETAPCYCTYRELLLESSLAAESIRAMVSSLLSHQLNCGLL